MEPEASEFVLFLLVLLVIPILVFPSSFCFFYCVEIGFSISPGSTGFIISVFHTDVFFSSYSSPCSPFTPAFVHPFSFDFDP